MKQLSMLSFFLLLLVIGVAQNVGINDAAPSAKLTVKGSDVTPDGQAAAIKLQNTSPTTTNAWYLRAGATGNNTPNGGFSISDNTGYHFNIDQGGNIGIGILPSAVKLHINGAMKIEGLNTLEFGAGIAGKSINAGKIGYNSIGFAGLNIVGAGTNSTDRKMNVFAEGGTTFYNSPIIIGTTPLSPTAALEISSTTKGFLPPRMTTANRDLIVSPATGLTIFNTTRKGLECYNGSAWYSTVHYVGERYGGGIVFFVFDGGQHGLISATADHPNQITWAEINFFFGATANGYGAGAKNSIVVQCQPTYYPAALHCFNYSVTDGDVTYGDWYLPSKYELNKLFLQKTIVGGFSNFYHYWSSTEIDMTTAWLQDFETGVQQVVTKRGYQQNIRAIRSF